MDATGQIGAIPEQGHARPARAMGLRSIALIGSALAWLAMFVVTFSVVIWNARGSVQDETDSAFQMANTVAMMRLPTSFGRNDLMAEAAQIAIDIRAQRHVTAELRDAKGQQVALPAQAPRDTPAPEWFADLLRPEPKRDLFPITRYPNVMGMLEIRSEPSDEIAEAWQDLRVLLPLLGVMAMVAIGVTMAVTGLVLRRLGLLRDALGRMQDGALDEPAPLTGLRELNALTQGVNALATHLADERAQNRRLQARMMTLAEAERARIASDLHDEIGPQLFALHAAVGQATRHETNPELTETLAAISRHSAAIRQSARSAIDDLRLSPTEGATLVETIQELLIEFQDIAPQAAFHLDAQDLPEPDEAGQIAIYRFVRESVLNALRHAAPDQIQVGLRHDGNQILACVSDDGTGPRAGHRRGLGQAGMRDRAAALGASYLPPQRRGAMTITEFRISPP